MNKEEAPPPAGRRLGGLLTAIWPCGTIVGMLPIPRGESLVQVHALVGQIALYRPLRYVVYDNACAIAHFARNIRRRYRTSMNGILASLTYVLDRFHIRNHTTCMTRGHWRFVFEVDVYAHAALDDVNTSVCEQFHAWIDRAIPSAANLHPSTFRVFRFIACKPVEWVYCASRRAPCSCHANVHNAWTVENACGPSTRHQILE